MSHLYILVIRMVVVVVVVVLAVIMNVLTGIVLDVEIVIEGFVAAGGGEWAVRRPSCDQKYFQV